MLGEMTNMVLTSSAQKCGMPDYGLGKSRKKSSHGKEVKKWLSQ
jgi:hypothetical protein